VICEGEILGEKVRFPAMMMEARAQRARHAGARFYGCKLLVVQLVGVQSIRDPARFVAGLDARGWAIIRLTRRNVLRQSLSVLWAVERGKYHRRTGASTASGRPELLTVVPEELITQMHVYERANAWIDEVAAGAHRSLTLIYEDDLEAADGHQSTVDTVMGLLGGQSSRASTDLLPTGKRDLSDSIRNFGEIVTAIRETKFAPLLEDEGRPITNGAAGTVFGSPPASRASAERVGGDDSLGKAGGGEPGKPGSHHGAFDRQAGRDESRQ
jgi:hypothetical protein